MSKLIVIIPYFGTLPPMFKFWLSSAKNNPTIDFLFITDCPIANEVNIRVVKMSFSDLRTEIQSCFDFKVSLDTPYKLCDYKPAYGYIFHEYIETYDFWGFGDIDLVYGDLRLFLTNEVLRKYDVISGWGHLTFYRNNDSCNSFFMEEHEGFQYYRDVYQNPKNCAFDEYWHKGVGDAWKSVCPEKVWDSRLFDDVTIPALSYNFKSVFHPEHSENLIFQYEDKKLYRIYTRDGRIIKEQTMYAHFQQRKFLRIGTSDENNYLVVPNAFISTRKVTLGRLRKWGRPQNIRHWVYLKRMSLKKRLRNMRASK